MITRERFVEETNWKMSYEEYKKCSIPKSRWIKDMMNCSKKDLYGLNPTAWEQKNGEWKRLEGY